MSYLRTFWRLWKRLGEFMGNVVARVVLTLFYFTILAPFGLGVRLFGDPLEIRRQQPSGWLDRRTRDRKLEDARKLS